MRGDVSFGQYYPTTSFVHKMDPRCKLLLLIAYIVAVFLAKNFLSMAACAIFVVAAIIFSRVPITSVLRSMRGIIFLMVFTFFLNVLFHTRKETDTILFWVVTKEGLTDALFLSSRILLLVFGSSILTLTTTPVDLTDGLESLLKPLTYLKVPVYILALIMSIALRFIPTLSEETDRIIKAQKARGGDFESGNLIKRAKALIPILAPLLLSSFRRADELGDAMDSRCFNAKARVRTKYKKLVLGLRDLVGTLFVAALITGIVFLNIYKVQIYGFIGNLF